MSTRPPSSMGSSPRGRGKRVRRPSRRLTPGLIPARAGKTEIAHVCLDYLEAHPRAGGENQDENIINLSKQGSSPRGRGKPRWTRPSLIPVRLIPARAGKTFPCVGQARDSRAHPRAGGENKIVIALVRSGTGSSPRGRGKLPASMLEAPRTGLIPARAGKTPCTRGGTGSRWAHPRAGGENYGISWRKRGEAGSSPRGRGKRSYGEAGSTWSGLIPARAGKTLGSWDDSTSAQAHPRAGGENVVAAISAAGVAGSSPRGRGKPYVPETARIIHGLIPARAGKTAAATACSKSWGAHPRAGGENAGGDVLAAFEDGSSPRGRGKPASGCCGR